MPETRGLCLSEEQTVTSVWHWKIIRFCVIEFRGGL